MGLKNKDAFIHIGIVGPGCGMSSHEVDFAIEGRTQEICKNKARKKEIIDMLDTVKKVIEKNY
jgi:hypothetical protein